MKIITTLWIDESGDCGFKFGRGSSRVFVIVAVYVETNEEDIAERVRKYKATSGFSQNREFKFSRCYDALKEELLSLIVTFPIKYKAIVVNKKDLKAPALQYHPHELYCEAMRRLLYDNNPPLHEAALILDEATAKIHHKEFNNLLKKYLSKNLVKGIRQSRSKGNIMIQIADMIAGSIFRMHEKGEARWYGIIKSKEQSLIIF